MTMAYRYFHHSEIKVLKRDSEAIDGIGQLEIVIGEIANKPYIVKQFSQMQGLIDGLLGAGAWDISELCKCSMHDLICKALFVSTLLED